MSRRGEEKPRKSEVTRKRILDAAARRFREHGYASVTLSDIARDANIQTTAAYYYFSSKEDIVAEVLAESLQKLIDDVRARLAAQKPGISFRAHLRIVVSAHLEILLGKTDYSSADIRIIGQVPNEIRERIWASREQYGEIWMALFELGRAQGEIRNDLNPSIMRMLVLGSLNYASEWFKIEKGPIEDIVVVAVEFIYSGLTHSAATAISKPKRRA